ncbi:MAG TPA: MOSC N-terminal beta barrel domain-containing protein [Myxococcaceae bacterium]|nr:MOSC N-terminal beta barrel domain-containing protein [Myxococcaceae bacterium]
MFVSSLFVYPVKSARGLAVPRARVSDRGFAWDRRFMVVDPEGSFLTQRELPRLALVEVALGEGRLTLRAPGQLALEVPLPPDTGARREVEVWGDVCPAGVIPGAGAWLEGFLGTPCELVYMPDEVRRPTPADSARAGAADRVGFADAFPFLLTTTASLEELARRGADVPMDRFRPNLVVSGCEPFAEDGWRRIRVGGVVFHVVKPCDRCATTTVDQATGETGKEPLRTLASFRRREGKVYFGQNLLHEGSGEVAVGDPVVVLD